MHLLRTRFKDEIVVEFLMPKRKSRKAIIFCDGLPSMPNKRRLLNFWAKKGYWVFHPRYRGTWESGGEFLVNSPVKDIIDVVDEVSKRVDIINYWNNTCHEMSIKEIFIIGGSFGGTASLLASRDKRVKKVVCISPVVDWTAPSEEEPLEFFGELVKNSFGEAYRFTEKNWEKLCAGKFFNPVRHMNGINGKKVMIIHARDDKVVMPKPVKDFADKIKCKFKLLKVGGHLSSNITTRFDFSRKIKKFLEE